MQQRFLLQILLLAQHVSGITMSIIRSSRVLYSGWCLWYFVLWFSSCWSGVELRVMCPVCRMLQLPLSISISCLHLLPRLPINSFRPSISPCIKWFRKQFLRQMLPINLAFLFINACRTFLSALTVVTLLHFSHDRNNWFYTFFSRNTSQNFPRISDLHSEGSKFQHHTKLYAECRT